MATIEDLDIESITSMSRDEALELLRQVRLSRRMPSKRSAKVVAKRRKEKALPKVDADQAAELLKLLGG